MKLPWCSRVLNVKGDDKIEEEPAPLDEELEEDKVTVAELLLAHTQVRNWFSWLQSRPGFDPQNILILQILQVTVVSSFTWLVTRLLQGRSWLHLSSVKRPLEAISSPVIRILTNQQNDLELFSSLLRAGRTLRQCSSSSYLRRPSAQQETQNGRSCWWSRFYSIILVDYYYGHHHGYDLVYDEYYLFSPFLILVMFCVRESIFFQEQTLGILITLAINRLWIQSTTDEEEVHIFILLFHLNWWECILCNTSLNAPASYGTGDLSFSIRNRRHWNCLQTSGGILKWGKKIKFFLFVMLKTQLIFSQVRRKNSSWNSWPRPAVCWPSLRRVAFSHLPSRCARSLYMKPVISLSICYYKIRYPQVTQTTTIGLSIGRFCFVL